MKRKGTRSGPTAGASSSSPQGNYAYGKADLEVIDSEAEIEL